MMAQGAVAALTHAQPDITLLLDMEGVIREATSSEALPDEDLSEWIGRSWLETVVDPGCAKVQRMLDDARAAGVSAFRQINQRFPSGLELPIEYTAVRVGREGLIAVGKSLQAVADLQSRLIAAQLAMERDYWRLREVETRCRVLFDTSNDAVLLLKASNLRIVEANPAATRALGQIASHSEGISGQAFLANMTPEERSTFEAMLHRVRDQGKAPGVLVRLGAEQRPWLVRASPLASQEGLAYLLQLTPTNSGPQPDEDAASVEAMIERSPDGFIVLDRSGVVLRANRAFLDLVQVGHETSVKGERLGRWLGRPGADTAVLLANVARYGVVRLFSTTLLGELGTGTDVEVSAAGDRDGDPRYVGVWIRDVTSRLPTPLDGQHLGSTLGGFSDRIGKTPLRLLVKEAVGLVERYYIDAALELTAGNRTAAAQLLGLSRQSLYAKLNRYGLEEEAPQSSRETD